MPFCASSLSPPICAKNFDLLIKSQLDMISYQCLLKVNHIFNTQDTFLNGSYITFPGVSYTLPSHGDVGGKMAVTHSPH